MFPLLLELYGKLTLSEQHCEKLDQVKIKFYLASLAEWTSALVGVKQIHSMHSIFPKTVRPILRSIIVSTTFLK
jgi:hypothetical protein